MSCAAIDIPSAQQVGRYTICDQLAAGGMATVHFARLVGSAGFSRVVAAKRMHRHFLSDPEFKQMFLAEAQLAARIQHPNVVPILDVLMHGDELIIFMDYVHGESLHSLLRLAHESEATIPISIGCAIIIGALQGLHAAHEARSEVGEPLGIVHRDISPQNILVGADGVARVLDFGIAKAIHEQNHTDPGTLKGKFSYMAPEVIHGGQVTRLTDVFSAGVVLWELLTGRRLFGGVSDQERLRGILKGGYPSPREFNSRVPATLELVVAKALQADPKSRFESALDFAIAIEVAAPFAAQHVVGEWVRRIAAGTLAERMALIHKIQTSITPPPTRPSVPPAQSLAVRARSDVTRQSVLTAVDTPSAKRRTTWQPRLLMWGAFVGVLALTLVVWLRLGSRSNAAATDGAVRVSGGTLPSAATLSPPARLSVEADTASAPARSGVEAGTESAPARLGVEADAGLRDGEKGAAVEVDKPSTRKPSTPRAASAPRARAKVQSNAKPYLPSEL